MIFDLKGKRRRVVQVVYLTSAVLMAGGFVFFGIGSEVSGGLFDAFRESDGGGGGDSLIEGRVESAQARLKRNPRDAAALRELARAEFQLAGQDADPNTGAYREGAKDNLARAASAWERYLALERGRPDASLATVMVQAYAEGGLNRPAKAAQAAEILAESKPTAAAYLLLARYATLAKQTRKADLAGDRALELAPKSQRKNVRAQIAAFKAQAAQPPAGGGDRPAGGGAGGG
ncbi:MAG: hypothetical protein M3N16_02820 [Actinomycetota bacterium]|nr:hypothetical protein [Actinomycetota bacterium]